MAKKSQIQKFREMAQKLEADESEGRFDSVLRRVAQHKPQQKAEAAPKRRKKR